MRTDEFRGRRMGSSPRTPGRARPPTAPSCRRPRRRPLWPGDASAWVLRRERKSRSSRYPGFARLRDHAIERPDQPETAPVGERAAGRVHHAVTLVDPFPARVEAHVATPSGRRRSRPPASRCRARRIHQRDASRESGCSRTSCSSDTAVGGRRAAPALGGQRQHPRSAPVASAPSPQGPARPPSARRGLDVNVRPAAQSPSSRQSAHWRRRSGPA